LATGYRHKIQSMIAEEVMRQMIALRLDLIDVFSQVRWKELVFGQCLHEIPESQ
jgi:hypothetical protein